MPFHKKTPGLYDELGGPRPNPQEHSMGAMKAGSGPGSKSKAVGKIEQTSTSAYKGDGQVGRTFSTKPHPWWEARPGSRPAGKSGSGKALPKGVKDYTREMR